MLLQSDEPNSDGIFSVMIVVKWGSLTTKKVIVNVETLVARNIGIWSFYHFPLALKKKRWTNIAINWKLDMI